MKVKMREWRYERKGMWLRRGGNNEIERVNGGYGVLVKTMGVVWEN